MILPYACQIYRMAPRGEKRGGKDLWGRKENQAGTRTHSTWIDGNNPQQGEDR